VNVSSEVECVYGSGQRVSSPQLRPKRHGWAISPWAVARVLVAVNVSVFAIGVCNTDPEPCHRGLCESLVTRSF
jgi:hypothetical protein